MRTLLRGLSAFRSYRESDGIDEIVDESGISWTIWDIERVYECALREPAQVGPFVSLAQAVQPGWLVKHTGNWTPILRVEPHPSRAEIVVMVLQDERIKRRRRDSPMTCLTPNRWRLMQQARTAPVLPLRQRQAIELYLVQNLPEEDIVAMMGIKPNNPIRMYATSGLLTLLRWMDEGLIPSPFVDDDDVARAS